MKPSRQSDVAAGAQDRGDMAVGQGTPEPEQGVQVRMEDGPLEHGAQSIDELRGHA